MNQYREGGSPSDNDPGEAARGETGGCSPGTSIVIVTCISALILAFALALTHLSGLLLARAGQKIAQERSRQLAESFAGVLDRELKLYEIPGSAPGDSFYRYACQFLEGRYGEYDPDQPDATVFHYTAASPSVSADSYGQIRVAIYKEAGEEQEDAMTGEISADQADWAVSNRFQRYLFTVEVTAEADGVSWRCRTEYRQMASYDVIFRHGGQRIVWDAAGGTFRLYSLTGEPYTVPDGEMIRYEYRTDSDGITGCRFEEAVWEGGET